jgi:hypothetical protein
VPTMRPIARVPDVDDPIGGEMDSVLRIVRKTRQRSLAMVCVALSIAVVVGVPPKASAQAAIAWSIVSSPNEEGSNSLVAVDASAGDNAWSVGYYLGYHGVNETLAERWDGSRWTLVETPNVGDNGSQLYGVAALSPSDAWAVGYSAGEPDTYTSSTLVEHWTGSAWSVVPSPNPSNDPLYGANQLNDVRAFAPNDVWAAGWQWTPIGSAPLIERWDGRRWRVSRTPTDAFRELQALDGTSSRDIWAVGHAFTFSDGKQSLIMHWDGRSWAVVPTPKLPYDNYLTDVTVVSPTDAWAVGYTVPPNLDFQPHFLHWNGSAWAVVPSPHLSSTHNYLQAVAAVSGNQVWAAGYRTVNGQVVTFVERWDGARWSIDPTPNLQGGWNYLSGLSVDPGGGLWSAGYFYPHDFSGFRTLIMHRSLG